MKIHQILINDNGKLPNNLPPYAETCVKSIKDFYGGEEYHLYCGEEIEEIIKNNFDKDIYISYQKLKPYAYKADLARYCLLYLYGGLYVDLNTKFICKLEEEFLNNWNFFAFRDMIGSSVRYWSVSNTIIFSKKECKILEKCIEIIVNNCKKEYYGIQNTEPTGPIVLGQSIILAKEQLCCTNGEMLFLNAQMPLAPKRHWGFFTDFGEFIAIRKPCENGDLESIGFEKINNYKKMWENLDVYNSNIKF